MMRLISSIVRAALSVPLVAVLLIGVVVGCYWLSLIASLDGLEAGIREHDVVKLRNISTGHAFENRSARTSEPL